MPVDTPRQLTQPAGIQLEDIAADHQHIDLIYFAVPLLDGAVIHPDHVESVQAGWYALSEMRALGVNDEVRTWAERAVQSIERARTEGELVYSENQVD